MQPAEIIRRKRDGHALGTPEIQAFARGPADFVITDLKMAGMDGLEVLRRIRELDPDCPTLLVTAGLDPLRDGGRAFAAKLAESGVPVSFYEVEGMIHGFFTLGKLFPKAQEAVALAGRVLGEALAR